MGCGRVGSTLANSLEDRNHTVSIIDSEPDADRVRTASPTSLTLSIQARLRFEIIQGFLFNFNVVFFSNL